MKHTNLIPLLLTLLMATPLSAQNTVTLTDGTVRTEKVIRK